MQPLQTDTNTNTKAPADFRSDTVTKPTASMMEAIATARLGDDVYGEDEATNNLEAYAADLFGKEAGLFVPSGTQSNLIGVMVHCNRGDEYIIGKRFHIYRYEAGGTSVLGSVFPHPLDTDLRGCLQLDDIQKAIKDDDSHFAITKLVCVENSSDGFAHDINYMNSIADLAHEHGLKAHCDGARIMNAAVSLGVNAKDLLEKYDTVSVCLSKGLGAPAGSILLGSETNIKQARRLRKMLGGGMRQAGILAAAGLHALTHHVDRLHEDHARAKILVSKLSQIDGIQVNPNHVETNMVFVRFGDDNISISDEALGHLSQFMAERGVIILSERLMRLVIHLDIEDDHIDLLCTGIQEFIAQYGR